MLDISRISTIDIRSLSEDETDSWCRKILKYSIDESNELDKSDLLALFQFTRSLLNVKHIQTEVLLEELQNVEQKFEDIQNEFDLYKNEIQTGPNNNDLQQELQEKLENLERELRETIKQRQELSSELEQKDRELMQLKISMNSSSSGVSSSSWSGESGLESERIEDFKIKLKEKNEQIEQLLDKLYDSDRINLDLAEQIAKLRVDISKAENDNRLFEARCQMLEKQLNELELLNENLMHDRELREQELNQLRKQLDETTRMSVGDNGQDQSSDFYQKTIQEIERLKSLLKVKDSEIEELKEFIQKTELDQGKEQQLAERRDQIERLEEELSVLTEGLVRKVQSGSEDGDDPNGEMIDSIKCRKLNRRIRKLKKQTQMLQLRIEELEQEARIKDEELARQKKRMSMLIGGDERLKKLFEENAVLSRMVRSRDNRIEFLINQLNKHQLVPTEVFNQPTTETGNIDNVKQDMEIHDQLISVTVERDVLQRQVDVLKTHLETVHKENLELQMGMKEILDGIRQSDAQADLVLECPSLERLCRLMENRSIYHHIGGEAGTDLTQLILLKSELDHVRGQNEQLNNELKDLRADFFSVIDEYTNDILDNWTISNHDDRSQVDDRNDSSVVDHNNEVQNDDNDGNDDEDDFDDLKSEDSDESQLIISDPDEKSTEGSRSRPRSRIQRRTFQSRSIKRKSIKSFKNYKSKTNPMMKMNEPKSDSIDVGLDPIKFDLSQFTMEKYQDQSTQTIELQPDSKLIAENNDSEESTEIFNDEKPGFMEQKPEEPKNMEKIDSSNNKESPEEKKVFLQHIGVQTVEIVLVARSIQTEEITKESESEVSESKTDRMIERKESESECHQCKKNLSMLESVRRLVEKERQQFRLQETKQSEQIDSLKQNLRLVRKEYQLDLDAKNQQIEDLRNKMMKITSSFNSIANNTSNKQEELIIVKEDNNSNLQRSNPEDFMEKIALPSSIIKTEESSPVHSMQNKIILETIVECLQKCLKQKDEAIEEYRSMIEQMRETYTTKDSIQSTILWNNQENKQRKLLNDNKQPIDNISSISTNDDSFQQLEKIFEQLFVKPKVQENDQLMELLRSTLHQLESVRTKSRERIKQLEIQLEEKHRLIFELENNLDRVTKESISAKNQIRTLEAQCKEQNEKIQSLTIKLNDMIRRNQQSIQTATALKKKVDNTVFQESADLRSKITELTSEVRRLEVEKWNVEKRLSQERQAARERLSERDQQAAQQAEQISKLQSLVAKLEKKLLQNKKQSANINNHNNPQQQQENKETKDKNTQTLSIDALMEDSENRLVRFNQIQIQRESKEEKPIKNKVGSVSSKSKPKISKTNKKQLPSAKHEMIHKEKSETKTTKIDDNDRNVPEVQEEYEPVIEIENQTIKREEEKEVEVEEVEEEEAEENLEDSSRQIIIDEILREQMSTIMNEISIVGNEMIKNQKLSKQDSINNYSAIINHNTLTIPPSSSSIIEIQRTSTTTTTTTNSTSSSNSSGTDSICTECESKFNANRIEQHLIDLRLERLLDENVRLKLELGSSRRKFTTTNNNKK